MNFNKTKRIVIGVCGHKDITTPQNIIRKALQEFWNALFMRNEECSFHVLDSLAEGGDQYVLESKPEQIPYTAVLPFASEIYEKDFETPDAKRIYRDYLNSAESIVVAGNEPGNYVPASEYLLAHSDLILALWDCIITEGVPVPGGSYDTITKAQAKGLPVIVIPTRRKKTYSNIKQDIFPDECVSLKLKQDLSFERFAE